MPARITTIMAPIKAGTNEKPTTIGPHVPKMSGPIQFPIKPATRDPAHLPGILTGDILSATIPITNAIITERIKVVTLMQKKPFF